MLEKKKKKTEKCTLPNCLRIFYKHFLFEMITGLYSLKDIPK